MTSDVIQMFTVARSGRRRRGFSGHQPPAACFLSEALASHGRQAGRPRPAPPRGGGHAGQSKPSRGDILKRDPGNSPIKVLRAGEERQASEDGGGQVKRDSRAAFHRSSNKPSVIYSQGLFWGKHLIFPPFLLFVLQVLFLFIETRWACVYCTAAC